MPSALQTSRRPVAPQRALPGVQVTTITQAPALHRWPVGHINSENPSPRALQVLSAPAAVHVAAPGAQVAMAQRLSAVQSRPAPQSASRRHATHTLRAASQRWPAAQSIAVRQPMRVMHALPTQAWPVAQSTLVSQSTHARSVALHT